MEALSHAAEKNPDVLITAEEDLFKAQEEKEE